MSDYLRDYRTLGLEPGCSLPALKAARRRLMKSWHPDRFPDDGDRRRQAEERIKEINTAFDRLLDYHETFGTLPSATATAARGPSVIIVDPVADPAPPVHRPESATGHYTRTTETFGTERIPPRRGILRWTVTLVVIVLLAEAIRTALVTDRNPAPPAEESAAAAPSEHPRAFRLPPRTTSDDYFTVGSSLGDVYAVQGVPTATEPGVWHYGRSKVYFANGVVTAWEHDPAYPLKATAMAPPTSHAEPRLFTIGSTKAEVRSVQGAPLVETDTLWDYGLSKVYFRDDRVTGWESSPLHPLKARK